MFPSDDILNPSQRTTERWEALNQHIVYRCYGSPETIHKSFKKLKEQIIWANAAMNTMNEVEKLKLEKPE